MPGEIRAPETPGIEALTTSGEYVGVLRTQEEFIEAPEAPEEYIGVSWIWQSPREEAKCER